MSASQKDFLSSEPHAQVFGLEAHLGDLEAVTTRTRIVIDLGICVPHHVLDCKERQKVRFSCPRRWIAFRASALSTSSSAFER